MPESESGALPFGDSAIPELISGNVGKRIRTPDLLVRSQTLYPAELCPHNIEMMPVIGIEPIREISPAGF